MKIDIQCHYYPDELIKKLLERDTPPRAFKKNGQTILMATEHTTLPALPHFSDLDDKLQAMDEAGVDVQVLSLNVPGPELAGGQEADDLAELAHDCLAEITRKRPDRFWGMATLGLGDMDRSLKELDRCLNDLGFKAVQVYSNLRGTPLDDPFFHPLYERCAELNLPIFLHPTAPALSEAPMADYGLIPIVGFLFDTTLAALRLIMSGTLNKYPNVRFVLPHVGSTIPYLIGRIDYLTGLMPGGREHIEDRPPSEFFKQLYFDVVSSYQPAIDYFYREYGADHLLFGSDYPWVRIDSCVDLVENLSASGDEKENIYSKTALNILKG